MSVSLKTKLAQLDKLERIVLYARHTFFGPRVEWSIFVAVFTFFASAFAFKFHPAVHVLVAFAAYVACFVLCKLPSTYSALVNRLMLQYQPFSQGAYEELKEGLSDSGYLRAELMMQWIKDERRSIRIELGINKPAERWFWESKA